MWTYRATVTAIGFYPNQGVSTRCWRWAKNMSGIQALHIPNTSNILPRDY